jgi:predicted nucleic acid-binding protein
MVTITGQVEEELAARKALDAVVAALPGRLRVEAVSPSEIDATRRSLQRFKLHEPDLSVAALAASTRPDLVLTDDLELRKALEARGHLVVGSVGILVRAFKEARLSRAGLEAALDALLDGSGLYLSKAFRLHVSKLLGNLSPLPLP